MTRVEITVPSVMVAWLRNLRIGLGDLSAAHTAIAAQAEILTRGYIRTVAAPSRHTTAQRLGANPTRYLERAADGVTSTGTDDAAVVTLSGSVDIFARVNGPVEIRARDKKLAIPATAAAYGRRPRELDLQVFVWRRQDGSYTSALGKVIGEGPNKERSVFYWLVDQVRLPQDRELLPSDDQYTDAAVRGLSLYIDNQLNGGAAGGGGGLS